MNYEATINNIVISFKNIFADNLVGIYLHGSFAMGCSTDKSDIDLLVVVEKPLSRNICRQIISFLLMVKDIPAKGIEMSIVLSKYCKNIEYPTPFELHYSEYHRKRYLSDDKYICGGFEDEDLAAHFMATAKRGKCLYGLPISDVFGEIPKDLYLKSILNDIEDAKNDIINNPIYHILNLCRTWQYVDEETISSKLEGGEWAITRVDAKYNNLVQSAIDIYAGKEENTDINGNNALLKDFVNYIYDFINFK